MPDEPFDLDIYEAADLIGVHPHTIRRWVKAGKMRAAKTPGGYFRFRRSDIDAWLTPVEPQNGVA